MRVYSVYMDMSSPRTVLHVTDPDSPNGPVVSALHAAGYELLAASSIMGAVAAAFVNRRLGAVVLDTISEQTSLRMARAIRSVRADLPIVLVNHGMANELPRYVDACVCTVEENGGILQRVLDTLWRAAETPVLQPAGRIHVLPELRAEK